MDDALASSALLNEGDPFLELMVLNVRGVSSMSIGDFEAATNHIKRYVETARASGRPEWISQGLASQAAMLVLAGSLDEALPLASESLDLARQIGAPMSISTSQAALAGALSSSDPGKARALMRDSLRNLEEIELYHHREVTAVVTGPARGSPHLELAAQAAAAVLSDADFTAIESWFASAASQV